MLTNAFWRDYYGADDDVVGRSIELLGEAYQIIGVLPEGHRDPLVASEPVLYLPLAFDPMTSQHAEPLTGPFLAVYGRPAAGVTPAAMDAAFGRAADELRTQFADVNEGLGS